MYKFVLFRILTAAFFLFKSEYPIKTTQNNSTKKITVKPGDDNAGGNLEGDDAPVAPINQKLIFLLLTGIIFAFYTFKKYRKKQLL